METLVDVIYLSIKNRLLTQYEVFTMLHQLIQLNFGTVILMICLLIFIMTNNYFDKRIKILFGASCMLVLCLVVADSVEYWTSTLPELTVLRIWMSAIGYSLRPAIIFVVILIMLRRHKQKLIWLTIPLIINTFLAFSALYTDIAYSYSPDNEFIRGPLGYFAFVTSGFYALVLLLCTLKQYKSIHFSETFITIAVVCTFVISTVMESVWKYDGVINTTGATALVFYYLYLNTQQFKRDSMTKTLNRRCFYLDAQKNISNLSAVMSIDLNNLKQWNDENGHAKGDDAICTLANCVQTVLPRNCFLYRTGGDEFMILCFHKKESQVKQLLVNIKAEVSKTPYSCAIGIAYNENQIDFDKLCSEADKAMYEDKFNIKKQM